MTTLIIPDIHNKIRKADRLIEAFPKVDKIIFLGDYFDDWNDGPNDAELTARWLKRGLTEENRVYLRANHDFGYQCPHNPFAYCPGWTKEKSDRVNTILSRGEWNKLRWYAIEQGYLITHAGLAKRFGPVKVEDTERFLAYHAREADINAANGHGHGHWFYRRGFCNGGVPGSFGGIIWNDYHKEFSPIPGLKQIFGHTAVQEPHAKDGNINLDTHLNHFLILRDGEPNIFALDEIL